MVLELCSLGNFLDKNIFHVMYCAKPCVHSVRGASTYGLGGATTVGIRYCQFFSVVEQIFN